MQLLVVVLSPHQTVTWPLLTIFKLILNKSNFVVVKSFILESSRLIIGSTRCNVLITTSKHIKHDVSSCVILFNSHVTCLRVFCSSNAKGCWFLISSESLSTICFAVTNPALQPLSTGLFILFLQWSYFPWYYTNHYHKPQWRCLVDD
jgi:hypothetical protein